MSHVGQRRRRRAMVAVAAVAATVLSGCSSLGGVLTSSTTTGSFPDITASTDFETYAEQDPEWVPCADGFECARVLAPENWAQPDAAQGEQVSLAVIRHRALGDEPPLGALLINPGGPGVSGVDYLQRSFANGFSDELKQRYDLMSWDPRGVGYSDAVACTSSAEKDELLFQQQADTPVDTDRASVSAADAEREREEIAELLNAENEYGLACLENTGTLLAHVDTKSTARDLEMLRSIAGDDKLTYLGFSYGTKIGAEYANLYPDRVGRMVLDGGMNPTTLTADQTAQQIVGFETALRAYAEDCLGGDQCALSGTPDEALAEVNTVLRKLHAEPLTAPDGRTVGSAVAASAIIATLYSQKSWPNLTQMLTELQQGDTRTTLALTDSYYNRQNGEYQNNQFDAFQAIICLDASDEPPLTVQGVQSNADRLLEDAPILGEFHLFTELSCAGWPVSTSLGPDADSDADSGAGAGPGAITAVEGSGRWGVDADPILVVGTTGDPATPYGWSTELSELLDSGVLVTYHGEGHIAYGRHSCPTQIIDDYLLTGTVPASDPHCARGS